MANIEHPQPLVSTNLSSLAFERLEQAIMTGELKPGERLSETTLARRYGISRGPLREAIGRLEGRNLVERVANQGARVISLKNDELIDLLVIRESLEGMACRLAATRIKPAELKKLQRMLEQHAEDEAVISGRGYFQGGGDLDFHYRIVRASGNARLVQMLDEELYSLLRLYRQRLSTRPGRPAQALEEHRRVLAALEARDPDAAEAAMRAHIQSSRASLERHMAATAAAAVEVVA
ncbi:transcriptional regulator [Thalassobaculum fulvum]|uniref:Transcriptional regulator n=1 Tax=Thalassobaculum fulvum TaxID=1633335 RepID=A0A918XWS5_9PROT|nr:GntR family transcriptional regulator [Thalassobaculum fulvum]GHD62244.1 transcriptional regulator [Thalassobaculum fulvum]